MSNLYQNYDVAIVGAGPSGAATAYFLANQGIKVLLLDKDDFPRDKTCGDGIGPRALAILDKMGLLGTVLSVGYRINQIGLMFPKGQTFSDSIPQLSNTPNFALVVTRYILDNLIREQAIANGAYFQKANITHLETDSDGVLLKTSKECFTAQMAVIATGANFRLLQQTGILTQIPRVSVAARAYYENVLELQDVIKFYFNGVPLPGYGWVFPTSQESANIGVGIFPSRRKPVAPHIIMRNFLQTSPIKNILASAQQQGPIRGYPIRVDFATAPTFGNRILLVGEAAGLVNPVSGEGIDYALESGQLAAQHLATMFNLGKFTHGQHQQYDQLLRHHFQYIFRFSYYARILCLNRHFLNWLAQDKAVQHNIRTLIYHIALGNPPNSILKTIFNNLETIFNNLARTFSRENH